MQPLWKRAAVTLVLVVVLGVVGCVPPQGQGGVQGTGLTGSTDRPAAVSRTLTMVDRHEPQDMAAKIIAQGGSLRTKRLFNASLVYIDQAGEARPYLAEALPRLNTESWRVFPDGRMETIYRLRPNLTWHDGTPLGSEDFILAWRIYAHPLLGMFSASPQDKVEEMVAPDSRTLIIRWRSPYPEAAALAEDSLDPLPRHILAAGFEAMEQDASARTAFLNHPFWTQEYVGAGPFRLQRWEPGLLVEGIAFDAHALGRPKIDRIIQRFMPDENAIMANVLSGDIQFATRTTLRMNHGQVLNREWVAAGKGKLLLESTALLYNIVQFRAEYQKTPALLDVRARRAMAHSINRQYILDGMFDGEGTPAATFVSQAVGYYADVDRAIAKYEYDPRRSEQLMAEVGFSKDRDGIFVSASAEKLRPDFQVLTSVDYERVQLIMADTWRRSGFDVQTSVLPHELVRDNQSRQTFPGIATPGAGAGEERNAFIYFTAGQVGLAANRWAGNNRGGWTHPDYERLWDGYNTTLERATRDTQVVQAMKLVSDEVAAFPLYYNTYVFAVASGLRGPTLGTPNSSQYWNVHEWELL